MCDVNGELYREKHNEGGSCVTHNAVSLPIPQAKVLCSKPVN